MCISTAVQGGRAWWVAPTYPMASIGWRMIKRLAAQVPGVAVRESERMAFFRGGGSIQVRSADNPDSLRGEGLDFLVMDECAFIQESAWLEALRPTLADRQGRALFISTPKGRNWFWRMWANADGVQSKAWRFSSYDNPFIEQAEIDAAKATLPERVFMQEFLAEFVEDGGGVIRRVTEAATATPQDTAQAHHVYSFGVDWGRSYDSTCIAVLDMTERSIVHVDTFTQVDYRIQLGRLQALYERFKPVTIIAESNSMGGPLTESLQQMDLPVVPFTTTNATKAAAIDALALAFERGDLRIVNDASLIAELQAYEQDRTPSGLVKYGAPDGMHDDQVIAVALSWQAVANYTPLLL